MYNPKKIKKQNIKLFGFLNNYFNLIDFALVFIWIIICIIIFFSATTNMFIFFFVVSIIFLLVLIIKTPSGIRIIYWFYSAIIFYVISPKKNVEFNNEFKYNEANIINYKEQFLLIVVFDVYSLNDLQTNYGSMVANEFQKLFSLINFRFTLLNFYEEENYQKHIDFLKQFSSLSKAFFMDKLNNNRSIEQKLVLFHLHNLTEFDELLLIFEKETSLLNYRFVSLEKLPFYMKDNSLEVKWNHLSNKDTTFTMLEIVEFDDELNPNFIKKLDKYNYQITFQKLSTEIALKQLKNNFSLKTMYQQNPKSLEFDQTLTAIEKQQQALYAIQFFLILEEKHFPEIPIIKKNLQIENIKFSRCFNLQFQKLLHINQFQFKPKLFLLSNYLNYLFDQPKSFMADLSGFPLGVDDHQNLIIFDPHYRDGISRFNNNNLIIGMSGSGKSHLLKKIVASQLALKQNTLIFDAEGEYFEAFPMANYLNLNLSLLLNFPIIFKFDQKQLEEHLWFIKEILHPIFANEVLENGFMEILQQEYQLFDFINSDALLEILIDNYPEQFLNKNIRVLFKNNLDFKFDFKNKLTILDVSALLDFITWTPVFKTLVHSSITYISNYFLTTFTAQKELFSFFIDELHLYLEKNGQLLAYFAQLTKRIRKRNGALFLATQNLTDLKNDGIDKYLEAILNNSNYYFFTKMLPSDLSLLKHLLSESNFIDADVLNQIDSFVRGEFLLSIQTKSTIKFKAFK